MHAMSGLSFLASIIFGAHENYNADGNILLSFQLERKRETFENLTYCMSVNGWASNDSQTQMVWICITWYVGLCHVIKFDITQAPDRYCKGSEIDFSI